MGNVPGVSAKEFHEEYYMFFDGGDSSEGFESSRGARKFTESRTHTGFSNRRGRMSSGDEKVVIRNENLDLRDLSTNNEYNTVDSVCKSMFPSESISDFSKRSCSSAGYYCYEKMSSANSDGEHESSAPSYSSDKYTVSYSIGQNNDYADDYCKEYESPSGKIYRGQWKGEELKEGRILWPDGREYCGSLENGKPHGFGIYKTKDGKEYRGHWQHGLQHGEGTYITFDGSLSLIRRGVWSMGKLKRWDIEDEGLKLQSPRFYLLKEIMDHSDSGPTIPTLLTDTSREECSDVENYSAIKDENVSSTTESISRGCTGGSPYILFE